MSGRFSGMTAFITGGASGIGKTTALAFAAEGASIAIATSRSIDKAAALAEELKAAYGVGAIGLKCDVRVEADVEAAVAKTVETFGSLDIAFNNAGVGPDGGVTIPNSEIVDTAEMDWDWVCDVNLKGTFLCLKHELRQMRRQGSGSIVCTASTAGLKPMSAFGAYGPSKAGLIILTKSAALENREYGIRCNVVCPGPTLGTGMADRLFGPNGEKGGPPRFGKTSDIAATVLWLSDPANSFITGNVICADGGLDII